MPHNLSWNVFRQTGSIETYLLMKELEGQDLQTEPHEAFPPDMDANDDLPGY